MSGESKPKQPSLNEGSPVEPSEESGAKQDISCGMKFFVGLLKFFSKTKDDSQEIPDKECYTLLSKVNDVETYEFNLLLQLDAEYSANIFKQVRKRLVENRYIFAAVHNPYFETEECLKTFKDEMSEYYELLIPNLKHNKIKAVFLTRIQSRMPRSCIHSVVDGKLLECGYYSKMFAFQTRVAVFTSTETNENEYATIRQHLNAIANQSGRALILVLALDTLPTTQVEPMRRLLLRFIKEENFEEIKSANEVPFNTCLKKHTVLVNKQARDFYFLHQDCCSNNVEHGIFTKSFKVVKDVPKQIA